MSKLAPDAPDSTRIERYSSHCFFRCCRRGYEARGAGAAGEGHHIMVLLV